MGHGHPEKGRRRKEAIVCDMTKMGMRGSTLQNQKKYALTSRGRVAGMTGQGAFGDGGVLLCQEEERRKKTGKKERKNGGGERRTHVHAVANRIARVELVSWSLTKSCRYFFLSSL